MIRRLFNRLHESWVNPRSPWVRTTHSWFSDAWIRLHEPRAISALYGVVWSLCILLGGYSIFLPPQTIEAVAGDFLMGGIALLITAGGAVGVVSVLRGAYWSERTAVLLVNLGVTGYFLMVSFLWVSSGGNRGLQSLALILAFILVTLRLYWVNERPYSKEHTEQLPTVGGTPPT